MNQIPLGATVKIVDDVGKAESHLIGKVGKVVGYKPNKFFVGGTIPIVQLEDGSTVSGWTLWYEVQSNVKDSSSASAGGE